MGWFNGKVKVTFIDATTCEPFATVEMPPADLPETFEIETTLHLGDADWSVVSAEPRKRPEYSKSGKLTLRLHRIEKVDLSDLLYSLPSICDRIPGLGDEPLTGGECALAEDDWRQLELVSRAFAAESDAEIASIRAIHEDESANVGWKKIHVRKRPDPPIASSLTLKDIERSFDGLTLRGVTYYGAPSLIAAGFSFRTAEGLKCYGTQEDDKITVLGIVQALPEQPGRSADALAEIAKEFDLDLVHWNRCVRVSCDDLLFRQLLTS